MIDGGYTDNTAVSSALSALQKEIGTTTPFSLTLFSSGIGDMISPSSIATDPLTGQRFKINEDVAELFGFSGGSLLNPDGPATASSVDWLKKPPTTIFESNAWSGERPIWSFNDGSLSLDLYELDVKTRTNRNYGITGGHVGKLYVLNADNKDSFLAPSSQAIMNELDRNYNVTRSAIASDSGRQLLHAIGYLDEYSLIAT